MNFVDFEEKLQAFMELNAKKWFAPEVTLQSKIFLVIFVIPVLIYIFEKKKYYHEYFYSRVGSRNITEKKRQINKIGEGISNNLAEAAKFAIIQRFGNGIVITENKLYYCLDDKFLSLKESRGSILLSDIRGITVDTSWTTKYNTISVNNQKIGSIMMYQSPQLVGFLKKTVELLYEQFNHKM
jgi:hypothetical protein